MTRFGAVLAVAVGSGTACTPVGVGDSCPIEGGSYQCNRSGEVCVWVAGYGYHCQSACLGDGNGSYVPNAVADCQTGLVCRRGDNVNFGRITVYACLPP